MSNPGRPHLTPTQVEDRKIKLINRCKRLATKLGRVPTVYEFNNTGWENIFGSWNSLIESCHFKLNRVTGTEREELVKRVLSLASKLGRTPSRAEFNQYAKDNNLCTAMVVQRYFGTWTEFLEHCKLEPNITRGFRRRKEKKT